MNILNIIQVINLGGMERSNLLRLKYYKDQGHKVRVVSLHPLGPGARLYEDEGIPIIGCEYKGKFGSLSHLKLRKIIKSQPADVIFVTGASVSSCLAAQVHQVPRILCVHYHHGSTFREKTSWKIFYNCFSNQFGTITFCSDFIRSEAESIFPKLKKKSITLRNIVEIPPELEKPGSHLARKRLGLPSGVPIIGNAGWLINRKRFDVLLRTASLVLEKVPDTHVAIAGGGECESMLRRMAQDVGLQDRIHWLGWLPDLADFYQSLDVLVFNSDFDALPRTPIEAMGWGVPVVASLSYGGLGEVLNHNEAGFFINNHNIQLLAEYSIALLNDKSLRQTMGQAGREAIKKKFDREVIGIQLNKLLDNVS